MNHKHCFRTIAEAEVGYVGICEDCRTVNVVFQNSLFCLTLDQIDGFYELITDRIAMRPFCTSHGKDFLMTTPMPNYFLLFSEKELDDLAELLIDAAPVLEAERILGPY